MNQEKLPPPHSGNGADFTDFRGVNPMLVAVDVNTATALNIIFYFLSRPWLSCTDGDCTRTHTAHSRCEKRNRRTVAGRKMGGKRHCMNFTIIKNIPNRCVSLRGKTIWTLSILPRTMKGEKIKNTRGFLKISVVVFLHFNGHLMERLP